MAERPTPHSIAVCTLIALYSDPTSQLLYHSSDEGQEEQLKKQREIQLSKFIQRLVLSDPEGALLVEQEEECEEEQAKEDEDEEKKDEFNYYQSHEPPPKQYPSLSFLLHSIDNAISTTTSSTSSPSQILLEDLLQSSTSIDSLLDLFTALKSTTTSIISASQQKVGVLDGNSSHGIYVRKRCLGFDDLSFESVGRLWECFTAYVLEGKNNFPEKWNISKNKEKQKNQDPLNLSPAVVPVPVVPAATSWPLSPNQIHTILHKKCQSLLSSKNSSQNSSSKKTKKEEYKLTHLQQQNPELPTIHFYNFLQHIQNKKRTQALQSLHLYFDYAMIRERKEIVSRILHLSSSTTTSATDEEVSQQQALIAKTIKSNHVNVVQYASILLAMLHAEYNDVNLAAAATQEGVRVAQQGGDVSCVAFALGWLHQVGRSGSGNEELLQRCINRALGNGIGSLSAGASFGLAMQLAARNGSHHHQDNGVIMSSSLPIVASPRDAWMSVASASTASSAGGNTALSSTLNNSMINPAAAAAVGGINNSGGRPLHSGTGGINTMSATLTRNPGTMMISSIPSSSTPPSGTESPLDEPTNLNSNNVVSLQHDVFPILANQHLISSSIWNLLGFTSLGLLSAVTAWNVYGGRHGENGVLSSYDVECIVHTVASSLLYGHNSEMIAASADGSRDVSISPFPNMIFGEIGSEKHKNEEENHHGIIDENHKSDVIVYADALRKLFHLGESYSNNSQNNNNNTAIHIKSWLHGVSLLLHEWSVKRCDVQTASSLSLYLHSIPPPPSFITCDDNYSSNDSDSNDYGAAFMASPSSLLLSIQSIGQIVLQQTQNRNWEYAKYFTSKLCTICSKCNLHYHHASYLLRHALIILEQDDSSNFLSALPFLLQCLSLCESQSIDSMHASALCILGHVHLKLDNYQRGRAMVLSCLPTLLCHGHVWFQGEGYLIVAKCFLREASSSSSSSSSFASMGQKNGKRYRKKVLKLLQSALSNLKEATTFFQRLQDMERLRELYYLRARIYDSMYNLTSTSSSRSSSTHHRMQKLERYKLERNKAAEEYGKISRKMLSLKTSVIPSVSVSDSSNQRRRCRIVWSDALVSAMNSEGVDEMLSLMKEELCLMEDDV